jgi:DNA invertase Pin-like site-specific DNA recombinase
MKSQGLGATKIAKTLGIGRASVYRILQAGHPVLAINHSGKVPAPEKRLSGH